MSRRGFTAAAFTLAAATQAHATFHLMQIEQVIGGVGGDTTAQAIQLRLRSNNQNLVSQARIRAWDANGQNPIVVMDMATNVAVSMGGARILIASPNFAKYTDVPLVDDFTMTALIPESYLAAGRLTFENNSGTQIWWMLCWGGDAYTGPTTGMGGAGSNDVDGNFGPPVAFGLPFESDIAVKFQGAFNALSTNNAANYALTTEAAVFTNNANASFTVVAPPPAIPGDLDDNGIVNGADLGILLLAWGKCAAAGEGCPADLDLSGEVDGADLGTLLLNWT
jgi:hypothetical protein